MRVAGLLLAAGRGTRFGGDKLLAPLPPAAAAGPGGMPVGIAAWTHLAEAIPTSVAIVRSGDAVLAERLRAVGATVLECPDADEGMGASLAFGIAACADADAWVVALADMPWIFPATIRGVAAALVRGAAIALPVFGGTRGHPVGFHRKFRDELVQLRGDRGARSLLTAHAAEVVEIPVADPGVLRDVDTPEDLARGSS